MWSHRETYSPHHSVESSRNLFRRFVCLSVCLSEALKRSKFRTFLPTSSSFQSGLVFLRAGMKHLRAYSIRIACCSFFFPQANLYHYFRAEDQFASAPPKLLLPRKAVHVLWTVSTPVVKIGSRSNDFTKFGASERL